MGRSKKEFIKMKLSTEDGRITTPAIHEDSGAGVLPHSAFLIWGTMGKGPG